MSFPEYPNPLPRTLEVSDALAAGYQLLDTGTVARGDIITYHRCLHWADASVGRQVKDGVFRHICGDLGRVYRKMPVPSHAHAQGLERNVDPVHVSRAHLQEATPTAEQATLTAEQATLTAEQATLTAEQATLTAEQSSKMPITTDGDDLRKENPFAPLLADAKPTNPKDLIGSNKIPLHLWPSTATALGALAFLDGALKYGRANWRDAGVRSSIYYDAASRHLTKWFEGEDNDPDSGLPHLAHALACIAILIDAGAAGKLTDDRALPIGYEKFVADLTPHVERLKARHADRNPKHYSIEDKK